MSATWGKNIRLTIFGESHGDCVGIVIDGIKPGVEIDYDYIYSEMKRRRPGNKMSTARSEEDLPRIISGVFNGYTTGAPITIVIENEDKKSRDYSLTKDMARPGHADFTARNKYKGYNDYRGGGHFSGRLTAPLVFAGSLAKIVLKNIGIEVQSHIKSICDISDKSFFEYLQYKLKEMGKSTHDISKKELNSMYREVFEKLRTRELPVLNEDRVDEIKNKILDAKKRGDSIGGRIECSIIGIGVGIGEPFFESVESVISSLAFSVPGVKGIEFGSGFSMTEMYGSEANDEFRIDENGEILTDTNNNGGLNGGITNSMPIEFTVAIKPTPSIFKSQNTINMEFMENTKLDLKGRHDPTIIIRALPVIESIAALSILSLLNE